MQLYVKSSISPCSALPFHVRQHIEMLGRDDGRKHTLEEEQDNWNRDRTLPEYREGLPPRCSCNTKGKKKDSFSAMSQIAPRTECTVCLHLLTSQTRRNPTEDPSLSLILNSHKDRRTLCEAVGNRLCPST